VTLLPDPVNPRHDATAPDLKSLCWLQGGPEVGSAEVRTRAWCLSPETLVWCLLSEALAWPCGLVRGPRPVKLATGADTG